MQPAGHAHDLLGQLGIRGDLSRIERLFEQLRFDHSETASHDPDSIARLWRSFLDLDGKNTWPRDAIERIAFLLWYEKQISTDPGMWAKAFRAVGFSFQRTQLEVRLRLGSRLFSVGRKPGTTPSDRAIRQAYLPRAIQVFMAAEAAINMLDGSRQKLMYGMRGVARLFLGRDGFEPAAMLRGCIADLEKSGQLGDATVEHDEYLREAYIRLFELVPDKSLLNRVNELFEGAPRKHRQYHYERGKVFLTRAIKLAADNLERVELLQEAVAAASAGLHCPFDGDTPDDVIKAQMGFGRLMLAQVHSDRETGSELLELAIEDLRQGAKIGVGGAALAQALIRRAFYRRRDSTESALADLKEAERSLADLTDSAVMERLRRQMQCLDLVCKIHISAQDKTAAVLYALCSELLSLGIDAKPFALDIIRAIRAIMDLDASIAVDAIGLRAATLAEERLDQDNPLPPQTLVTIASHAASLLRALGESHYARAHALYHRFIDTVPNVSAEAYSSAADTALFLAKQAARLGDQDGATDYITDAIDWYENALRVLAERPSEVSEYFLPVVTHSKLGEAYVRLQSFHGDVEAGRQAIKHLDAAQDLGNHAPELLGLLGDAHYRIGLAERDTSALRKALDLKDAARAAGHSSRESWSVSASIYSKIYARELQPALLTQALATAVEAHKAYPDWPWPLFQVANFIASPELEVDIAVTELMASTEPRLAELAQRIANRDVVAIETAAVRLAVATSEFRKDILGGRSQVYVLDDPHGLLSATVVLKPTKHRNARREISAIESLGKFLSSKGHKGRYSLPRPICIIDHAEGAAIYAMERFSGRLLADALLAHVRSNRFDRVGGELQQALEFLALFHAWAHGTRVLRRDARVARSEVERIGNGLSITADGIEKFNELLALATPSGLFEIPRKDAHPENWIVSSNGLMMIDLEASGNQPLLFEVAQLLDDYGILPINDEGFKSRMELAEYYLKVLGGLGISAELDRPSLERTYATFWILRCAFGIGRLRRNAAKSTSSSLKRLGQRHEHYVRSLTYLENSGPSPEVQALAQWLSAQASANASGRRSSKTFDLSAGQPLDFPEFPTN